MCMHRKNVIKFCILPVCDEIINTVMLYVYMLYSSVLKAIKFNVPVCLSV